MIWRIHEWVVVHLREGSRRASPRIAILPFHLQLGEVEAVPQLVRESFELIVAQQELSEGCKVAHPSRKCGKVVGSEVELRELAQLGHGGGELHQLVLRHLPRAHSHQTSH